jgi:DNA-directed RNA polymerase subunit RPC12/RpoP
MSDSEVTVGMSLPLDSDGFLRRECPTCEREFKWLHTSEGEGESPADGGYFCPYCGVQAPANAWLTQAQVELAKNTVATEVVGPMLERFARDIKFSVRYDPPEKLAPLTEVDDMIRVDFACHPSAPLKLLEDWSQSARCLLCGQPADQLPDSASGK